MTDYAAAQKIRTDNPFVSLVSACATQARRILARANVSSHISVLHPALWLLLDSARRPTVSAEDYLEYVKTYPLFREGFERMDAIYTLLSEAHGMDREIVAELQEAERSMQEELEHIWGGLLPLHAILQEHFHFFVESAPLNGPAHWADFTIYFKDLYRLRDACYGKPCVETFARYAEVARELRANPAYEQAMRPVETSPRTPVDEAREAEAELLLAKLEAAIMIEYRA